MKRIVIVAGDKSGDIYGGFLSKKLKEKFSAIEIYSFGGYHLSRHSIQKFNLLSYSVSGICEVISHIGKFIHIFHKTIKEIHAIKPDLIILIDFPDFNLRLAKTINKKYPVFYYISPQVWAWRKNRVKLIKKYINKMIVIFKFEEEFYKKEGIEVRYFGHPLLEIIENKECPGKKIISLMPGSRKNEIKNHLPLMLKAKKLIENELKGYSFRIIRPENIEINFYRNLSSEEYAIGGKDIDIVNHSYEAIKESTFIITSSGTATVEIAILEVPYLVIYKLNEISWWILKRLVNTRFVAMVNILSSEKIIDELLQNDATAENISKITLESILDIEKYAKVKNNLQKVKQILSPYGAAENFASFIGEFLGIGSSTK